jgi:hypothetical protein
MHISKWKRKRSYIRKITGRKYTKMEIIFHWNAHNFHFISLQQIYIILQLGKTKRFPLKNAHWYKAVWGLACGSLLRKFDSAASSLIKEINPWGRIFFHPKSF